MSDSGGYDEMSVMVSRGFTLTELLVVVAIVGLVASTAATSLTNADNAKLDAAASEVVNLIRFARSEAIRTGKAHGISASTTTQRIRPYIRSGFFGLPSYTVRNPADKNLYNIDFDTEPGISDVTLTTVSFNFDVIGQQALLGFNEDGTPKYESGSNVYLLSSGQIQLSLGNAERTVSVAPITGRVTVQ